MTTNLTVQEKITSLFNNYNEDITRLGCIQPHGVLLVIQEENLNILQVSQNSQEILGIDPQNLINCSLDFVLDNNQINRLKQALKKEDLKTVNPIKLSINTPSKNSCFDCILHRSNASLILELEPNENLESFTFLDFYKLIHSTVLKLHAATNLQELCDLAVQEIRQITQLDRVMIYRFNPDGNGTVIAEDKTEALEAYLGLNYPASDIPQQARRLFTKNPIRLIPDIHYEPTSIIPQISPITQCPLDLTFSVLRSPSPCHQEYLKNMGVRASIVIQITKENQLWGLIAGHHYTPKYFPYEVRAACEFLGQAISSELVGKETYQDYDYQLELRTIQTQLIQAMSEAEYFIDGLVENKRNLLDLVSASGVALSLNKKIITLGETPAIAEIEKLINWLKEGHFQEKVFYTSSLSSVFPLAFSYKEIASGLLAIAISESQQKYILWFRPEVLQTVSWAGNPQEGLDIKQNGTIQMSPRTSFALWKEQVQATSLPWKAYEIQIALDLRKSIISTVMRKADELAELNKELTQAFEKLKRVQTQLIQSEKMSSLGQMVAGIAHEINNPVNFIYGNLIHADVYAKDLLHLVKLYQTHYPQPIEEIEEAAEEIDLEFLIDDLPKLLKSMQLGSERIREIVQSLRNFSRIDEADTKAVDLHDGIDSTLLILSNRLKEKADEPSIHVIKQYGELPPVECYPSQLNQVFMNLLANAIDALEERDRQRGLTASEANPSTITITTAIVEDYAQVRIQDNGQGIPPDIQARIFDPFFTTKPVGKGTGMGLAISYQIVTDKHQGRLHCNAQPGEGTEFIVEIPIKSPDSPS